MIPPPLYALADADVLGADRLPSAVAAMAASGVGWIQIRAKNLAGGQLESVVAECRSRLVDSTTLLWLDDRVDIAATQGLGGVHLGQEDLPPEAARRVLPAGCRIGFSTHDIEQVEIADLDPAVDVVALGPIFATASKSNPEPEVGLETLRRARLKTAKPLVAIGGINATNIAAVLAAGADSAAVLGAVCHGDVAQNCARLLAATEGDAR